MGCCASTTRKTREPDGSTKDHPPDDHHHHLSDNRPPPDLALMSSVRTLRSHLAMSPPSTPFHPHRPPPDHHEQEILYPINYPKHVSSSNPRPGRYSVGSSQIAAFDRDRIDRAFVDLSATTFNFSKEVQFGGGERTPSLSSIRLGGSGRWSIDSPTPVPLAEIWKRRENRPPPPSVVADMWTATGRRLNKRERGNNWDPPGSEFSDTSSSGDTSTEMRVNKNMPRKVTFGEMPTRRASVFDDGPGPGRRAARRVARSRVGGWSPPEASRSFDDGMFFSGGRPVRNHSERNDDVLRERDEYDPANDLLSMEGFIFF